MRQRARFGLVFLAASAVLATTVVASGGSAGILIVLLLLVLLVQFSLAGAASKDLRARMAVLAGLGLLLFVGQVIVRVAEILKE